MSQRWAKALFKRGSARFGAQGRKVTKLSGKARVWSIILSGKAPRRRRGIGPQVLETPTQSRPIPHIPVKSPVVTYPVGSHRSIETLKTVMAALRDKETGCPWDKEQTFATIAPYTIEEAYEVADAIEKDDLAALKDELGDLLFQPIYHAQMASEAGAFNFDDVIEAVVTKMIRRHPHVFGDEAARAAGVQKGFWEVNKAKERAGEPKQGLLASVPKALPGLTRALKLQAKAAKVGFDWPSVENVYDKINEEIAEFKAAPADKKAEEFGDILFAMANVARHLGIDPEAALRGTNAKFERRFAYIEAVLAKAGKEAKDSNLAEMDALWNDAKLAERQG